MRTNNFITSALIISAMTSLLGVTQSQTWEHFGMFTLGATISIFLLGLIATEK